MSFNVDPDTEFIIDVRSNTTYQIEVIGMKPNGYFYFDLRDNLILNPNISEGTDSSHGWYTPSEFLTTFGVDCSKVQADINGRWSMNITIPAGADVYPKGFMQISGFGSKDPDVNIIPNNVFMYVTK